MLKLNTNFIFMRGYATGLKVIVSESKRDYPAGKSNNSHRSHAKSRTRDHEGFSKRFGPPDGL